MFLPFRLVAQSFMPLLITMVRLDLVASDQVRMQRCLCAGRDHDSQIANLSLYPKLLNDDLTPPGFAVVGDSAFRGQQRMHGKLFNVLKDESLRKIPDPESRLEQLYLRKLVVRLRQAAEWGMRGIQGPFARLKLPLSIDPHYRYLVLHCIVHLHNFRVAHVGLNQIRTVYAPIWNELNNVEPGARDGVEQLYENEFLSDDEAPES